MSQSGLVIIAQVAFLASMIVARLVVLLADSEGEHQLVRNVVGGDPLELVE